VSETLRVTVALARSGSAQLVDLRLPVGATLLDAIKMSALLSPAEMVSESLAAGVFNQVRPLDSLVRDGDRVEIYRPLTIDPKEFRRVRAELRRKAKKN